MNQNSFNDPFKNIKEGLADFSVEKKWAVACYVPVFNVLSCVLASVKMIGSKFCLFHARQGLILFGLWFLTIVVALISPGLSLMMWGVVLLFHGYGMYLAYNMKVVEIPVIGKLAMKIPENYFFLKLTGKKLDKPLQQDSVQQSQTAQSSVQPSASQNQEPPKTN